MSETNDETLYADGRPGDNVANRDWHMIESDPDALMLKPHILGVAWRLLPAYLGLGGFLLIIFGFIMLALTFDSSGSSDKWVAISLNVLGWILFPFIVYVVSIGATYLITSAMKTRAILVGTEGVAYYENQEYQSSVQWSEVQHIDFKRFSATCRVYQWQGVWEANWLSPFQLRRADAMWDDQLRARRRQPVTPQATENHVVLGVITSFDLMIYLASDAYKSMPEWIRPTHYYDFGTFNSLENVSQEDLEDYFNRNRNNYRLINDLLGIEYRARVISARRFGTLIEYPKDNFPQDKAEEMVNLIMAWQAEFGFIAMAAEYQQRHLFFKNMDGSYVSSFVGFNLERYLPGFYWRTVIRTDLAYMHQLGDQHLPQDMTRENVGQYYVVIEDQNDLEAYLERVDRVEKVAMRFDGIFSIRYLYDSIRFSGSRGFHNARALVYRYGI